MIAQPELEQETFKILLDKYWSQAFLGDKLDKMRNKAWLQFEKLGLPTKQDEAYRYIKLRHLFSHPYSLISDLKLEDFDPQKIEGCIFPECHNSALLFINGQFVPNLSSMEAIPANVVVSTLEEAMQTYGVLLNNHWSKSLKEETDPFAACNAALHRQGAFLYIPPKCQVEKPIQILHLIDAQCQFPLLMPRLQIFVGAGASVRFVQTQKHLSPGYFVNHVTELSLDEGASVHYTQGHESEDSISWHFDAFRAFLKRDSHLKTVCATAGSQTVRNDYRVVLGGDNAEALLNGVWMLNDKRESHVHVFMDHQSPHCRSFQLFKGILSDFSRSSFEGKIMVRQAAQKTEAFQLNNNLVLSDHAHADCKPNLEIFADDVKASHGATIGQLDPEQLFYMKTRGFTARQAQNLLLFGFCQPIIEMIDIASLHAKLSDNVRNYFSMDPLV